MASSKFSQAIAARYSHLTHQLAKKSAQEIHSALDAEVIRELGESFARDASISGEAKSMVMYTSVWRKRSIRTAYGLCIGGSILLGLACFNSGIERLVLVKGAIACCFAARKQQATAKEIEPILGILARLQAAQSAMALTKLWGKQPKAAKLAEPVTATTPEPITQSLKLFDLKELKDPDRFPHFLVAGPTGSGKTYTTEKLIKLLNQDTLVITPKRKPDQWVGLEVIGAPRDFPAIEAALSQALDLMEERMADLGREHPQRIIVIDEWPAIAANVESAPTILKALVREARETRIRVMVLSQGRQLKTLNLEGESDLRENLIDIYLGGFAEERARELANNKRSPQPLVLEWASSCPRPLLVADKPAQLS